MHAFTIPLLVAAASLPAALGARPLLLEGSAPAARALQQTQQVWSGFPPPASSGGQQAVAYASASASVGQQAGSGTQNMQPQMQMQPQQMSQQMPQMQMTQPQQVPNYYQQSGPQYQGAQQPQQGAGQMQMPNFASGTQAPVQPQGSAPQQGSSGGFDMNAILALHNQLRAKHGTAPLAFSSQLASTAQAWADRCVFQHSGPGENLAQYFADPLAAVQAWYDEIKMYTYGSDYSSATGHATQMLWKGSTTLGCGWAASCQLLVCHYDPPGNVIGQFPQNVSPPQD